MSGRIRKVYTCQLIKTEPVEENETSDVFYQFPSEPVDLSESKGDIKHESLTGVGLSCGQRSSGTTGSFEQSQFSSVDMKVEPSSDFDSNSSRDAEPVYFNDRNIKVKVESDTEPDPDEASTISFPVNIWRPHINNSLQTEEATDTKMTVSSMDEDENKSSSDKQVYTEPCPTGRQHPGSNKPATPVKTSPKPWVCDVCDKRFPNKQKVENHMLIHTDLKPYVCDACGKGFRDKSTMKNHKLTHSDIRQFSCDACHKSFKQRNSLRKHMQTHELPDTIQRPVCEACHKSFRNKYVFKRHMLSHTDNLNKFFVCDVCNRSFIHRSQLEQHKLTHTDTRQFACDVCNKSFKQKGNLTQHKLTHSNRQFVCDVCQRSFKYRRSMKFHRLTHTDIK